MSHLKSLASPKSWKIRRKERTWVARPNSGAHSLDLSVPLIVMLRDVIKVVGTKKEAKYLIRNNFLKVNGKEVKDVKLPIGLFDILSIDKEKKYYRIVLNKRQKLVPIEINQKESNLLPLKLKNKKLIKKGQFQLNFTNGWNMLIKDAKKYSVKDTLILDLKSNKFVDHLAFSKGNIAFIIGGKHIGEVAKIEKINDTVSLKNSKKSWEGLKKYVFIIGKKSPLITLFKK